MSSSKLIHVNSDGINDVITQEEEKLENLNNKIEEYRNLVNSLRWKSVVRDQIMESYEKNIEDMQNASKRIDAFIKFLDIVINNYGEGLEEVMISLKKMEDEEEMRRLLKWKMR